MSLFASLTKLRISNQLTNETTETDKQITKFTKSLSKLTKITKLTNELINLSN